jgi:hypothetical protein
MVLLPNSPCFSLYVSRIGLQDETKQIRLKYLTKSHLIFGTDGFISENYAYESVASHYGYMCLSNIN